MMETYKMFILISVISGISSVLADNIIVPCKYTDKACILSSARMATPKVLSGIPELGIPTSDPLFVKKVVGDLSTLKFTFDDLTATGFKNCFIEDLDLNLEKNSLKIVKVCANLEFVGNYTASGLVIILPVEGTGDCVIKAAKYRLTTVAEIKKTKGKGGKDYLSIKNFKGDADALEPIDFDLRNLFGGRKDLSDAFHKFANENYADVSKFAFEPLYNAVFRLIFKNVNKYLKTIPLNELFLS